MINHCVDIDIMRIIDMAPSACTLRFMVWYQCHSHHQIQNPERLLDDVDFPLLAQPHPVVVMDTLDPFVADKDTNDVSLTLALGRYRDISDYEVVSSYAYLDFIIVFLLCHVFSIEHFITVAFFLFCLF